MAFKYVGRGHLPGVPTRDLTDEEAVRYGVTRSPLYRESGPAPVKRAPSRAKPLPGADVLPEDEVPVTAETETDDE